MKGILSAYSCLPDSGSENGLGWNTLLSAAKVLDKVYLVTKKSNADKIERWKKQNVEMLNNVEFVYVDIPTLIRKLPGHFGQIIRYEYFQRKLIKATKDVVKKEHIDFCQHVTWASFIRKNYLYKLGIPVILGPVGGGEMIPEQINYALSLKERIVEWLRFSAAKRVSNSKIHEQMFDSAAIILTTTIESKMMIPKKYHHKIIVEQAIGIDKADYDKRIEPDSKKFIVLMSGRMLYWKGFEIGIKAFSKFLGQHPDAELHIFGDGKKRKELENLASPCKDSITFHGNVSHNDMLAYYKNGTVFLNCSLHDSGSFVVLESMANGLPVITIATGGPSVLTDEACAVRIAPADVDSMVKEIKDALEGLYSDRRKCSEMGQAAQNRAFNVFDYDGKYAALIKCAEIKLGVKE